MPDFRLEIVGSPITSNGHSRAKLLLTVDGSQKLVEDMRLDSSRSVSAAANNWSQAYGLDRAALMDQLNQVSVYCALIAQQRREKASSATRVCELATQWIKHVVRPEWHRARKSVYSTAFECEISIGKLWTLLGQDVVDRVGDTQEGMQGAQTFRARLGLMREAIEIAAAGLVGSLPEHEDTPVDKTVVPDDLRTAIERWLLKPRTYRTGSGVAISMTIWMWLQDQRAETLWRQCYTDAIFGRGPEADGGRPMLAVQGSTLWSEIAQDRTARRLAKDLVNSGLATTSHTLKCGGRTWRAWLLSDQLYPSTDEDPDGSADGSANDIGSRYRDQTGVTGPETVTEEHALPLPPNVLPY